MPDLLNHPKILPNNLFLKILILGSLLFSFILGLFIPNYFVIKEGELKGQNLLFLSTKKTIETLMANNPEIEKINLEKIYPNTLKITYIKSKPVAQIKTNSHYLLVSSKGKILQQLKQPRTDLLTIDYYQSIRAYEAKPGQTIINHDLLYSVKLVSEAKKQGFKLETAMVTKPGQIQMKLKTQKTLITFSSKKNIAKNWGIVHNILRSLKVKGQSPKEINLLFDKPFFVL